MSKTPNNRFVSSIQLVGARQGDAKLFVNKLGFKVVLREKRSNSKLNFNSSIVFRGVL